MDQQKVERGIVARVTAILRRTPVRAIHPGRVVFADWMRGYGLLTIVDHGGGYLTLYGYNQSLLRDVGEWVAVGDTLALAGQWHMSRLFVPGPRTNRAGPWVLAPQGPKSLEGTHPPLHRGISLLHFVACGGCP